LTYYPEKKIALFVVTLSDEITYLKPHFVAIIACLFSRPPPRLKGRAARNTPRVTFNPVALKARLKLILETSQGFFFNVHFFCWKYQNMEYRLFAGLMFLKNSLKLLLRFF